MERILSEQTAPRLAHFGREVFKVGGANDLESARLAITATYNFFKSLGVPMTFTELGVGSEHFGDMARHAVTCGSLAYAWVPLNEEDVVAIFEKCL
ncbi:MAG: iron-containing alcohol dehydrogenase [Succinivibrio sp.]|nr:iron-containing alcohol dehydrogenase [Succinivibrio sp.]